MRASIGIFGGVRVLYVDDEPENLQAFSYALLDECEVETFSAPSDALVAIERDPDIAVVVTDIRMPDMDGFEFLHRAAKVNPFTANVILTGHTDEGLAIKAVNSQLCVGYYKKDYAFAEQNLSRIIRDAAMRYSERHSREIVTVNATLLVKRLLRLRDRAYTHEHVCNVELLCRQMARYLDIPSVDKEVLVLAASFHDIGVLAAPDALLAGDGAAAIAERVRLSDEALRGLRGMEKCWLGAIEHGEHFDGSGPGGKKGDAISLFGRVLAVVDAFDGMMLYRQNRPTSTADQALATLVAESGRRFDPRVVEVFQQAWRENPEIAAHYREQNATLAGAAAE